MKNRLALIIAIVDAILLFALSVVSDQISKSLDISPELLLLLAAIFIVSISITGLLKANSESIQPQTNSVKRRKRKNSTLQVPRTMIGMFPIGVFLGIISSVLLTLLGFNTQAHSGFGMPPTISNLFGYNALTLSQHELLGSIFGLIIALLFSVALDALLSTAMFAGYNLAFATSLVMLASHEVIITYIGFAVWTLIVGVGLIIFSRVAKRIKVELYKPRV